MRFPLLLLLALCAVGYVHPFPSADYVSDRLKLEGYALEGAKGVQFYYTWMRDRIQDALFNQPTNRWVITPYDLPERYAINTPGRVDNYNDALERVAQELREEYTVVMRGRTVACMAWGFKHDVPLGGDYATMCQD